MPDRTNAERQAALRQREQAAGMVRLTVTIPEHRAAELASIVRRWKGEATNANVATLDAGDQQ